VNLDASPLHQGSDAPKGTGIVELEAEMRTIAAILSLAVIGLTLRAHIAFVCDFSPVGDRMTLAINKVAR
jgi:hypothetical protein